mmetsp:Transcript_24940/g.36785  ORF Transcript_24940/g.36785 Transcript_24940/m.36785 type:complete len:221 (-) Transcript_24940:463-1125(-)
MASSTLSGMLMVRSPEASRSLSAISSRSLLASSQSTGAPSFERVFFMSTSTVVIVVPSAASLDNAFTICRSLRVLTVDDGVLFTWCRSLALLLEILASGRPLTRPPRISDTVWFPGVCRLGAGRGAGRPPIVDAFLSAAISLLDSPMRSVMAAWSSSSGTSNPCSSIRARTVLSFNISRILGRSLGSFCKIQSISARRSGGTWAATGAICACTIFMIRAH